LIKEEKVKELTEEVKHKVNEFVQSLASFDSKGEIAKIYYDLLWRLYGLSLGKDYLEIRDVVFGQVGTNSTCSGGTSRKAEGSDVPGGRGGHFTADTSTGELTRSGGGGVNNDVTVGGGGSHIVCDPSGCSQFVGGSGAHPK
jgi:hypothetical protein